MFTNNTYYNGETIKDANGKIQITGKGTKYNKNDKILYNGEWFNDVPSKLPILATKKNNIKQQNKSIFKKIGIAFITFNPKIQLKLFIKKIYKTKSVNVLDFKIMLIFIYAYKNDLNRFNKKYISLDDNILLKFIKMNFYEFNKMIDDINRGKYNVNTSDLKYVFVYLNSMFMTDLRNIHTNINIEIKSISLYNYSCKPEYHILLNTTKLKKTINNDDKINIFCWKLNMFFKLFNKNSNDNDNNDNNITISDIYIDQQIKKLFIINDDDIINYNENNKLNIKKLNNNLTRKILMHKSPIKKTFREDPLTEDPLTEDPLRDFGNVKIIRRRTFTKPVIKLPPESVKAPTNIILSSGKNNKVPHNVLHTNLRKQSSICSLLSKKSVV